MVLAAHGQHDLAVRVEDEEVAVAEELHHDAVFAVAALEVEAQEAVEPDLGEATQAGVLERGAQNLCHHARLVGVLWRAAGEGGEAAELDEEVLLAGGLAA